MKPANLGAGSPPRCRGERTSQNSFSPHVWGCSLLGWRMGYSGRRDHGRPSRVVVMNFGALLYKGQNRLCKAPWMHMQECCTIASGLTLLQFCQRQEGHKYSCSQISAGQVFRPHAIESDAIWRYCLSDSDTSVVIQHRRCLVLCVGVLWTGCESGERKTKRKQSM